MGNVQKNSEIKGQMYSTSYGFCAEFDNRSLEFVIKNPITFKCSIMEFGNAVGSIKIKFLSMAQKFEISILPSTKAVFSLSSLGFKGEIASSDGKYTYTYDEFHTIKNSFEEVVLLCQDKRSMLGKHLEFTLSSSKESIMLLSVLFIVVYRAIQKMEP